VTAPVLSDEDWLDAHFEACRPEYESLLREAGIGRGWRVLDAGCGFGSHLPLLAELVGASGTLVAADISETALDRAAERMRATPVALELRRAALDALPFPDAAFDAAWCANALQYLDDGEARAALTELRRVVRPGGLVAVKDVDMSAMRIHPGDPFLVARLAAAGIAAGDVHSRGSVRGRELRRWLEDTGLRDVAQRTQPIERWAPLRDVERRLFGDWFAHLAAVSSGRDLPAADLEAWQRLANPAVAENPLNSDRFHVCEVQVLATGTVP
jgi:ubiquinone/menaquinone biosynthesis C-methylase UbiE